MLNSDASRVLMVDETGRVLSEELTLPIFARIVLESEKTNIVTTYSTSKTVDRVADSYGVRGFSNRRRTAVCASRPPSKSSLGRWRRQRQRRLHSFLSWIRRVAVHSEGCGFLERANATTVSALADEFSEPDIHKTTIPLPQARFTLAGKNREALPTQTKLKDGIYVEQGDEWLCVRTSSTLADDSCRGRRGDSCRREIERIKESRPMKSYENIKVGISGIRGIIGDTLTPENVINFTRAFSTLVRKGRVAVATDSRPSGEFVKNAVVSGLLYSRITPLDAGILPTPTLQVFVREKGLNGGVIVTASHNPEQWNGLKFVNERGLFLSPFTALPPHRHLPSEELHRSGRKRIPSGEKVHDAFRIHKDKILRHRRPGEDQQTPFQSADGPGRRRRRPYDKDLLESLGCEVDVIHGEIGKDLSQKSRACARESRRSVPCRPSRETTMSVSLKTPTPTGSLLSTRRARPSKAIYTFAIALMGYLAASPAGKGRLESIHLENPCSCGQQSSDAPLTGFRSERSMSLKPCWKREPSREAKATAV